MKKALVVLSGGQDSTACLFWAILVYGLENVYAVTFDYGQRHSREIDAAFMVASMAGIEARHELVQVGPILRSTSPLTSDNKLEQYADHQSLPGGLENTFVPMRNQLFLTLAANRAAAIGAEILVTGVCQEDSGGYPDCRKEFINALQMACNLGTFTGEAGAPNPLKIVTPLMYMTKGDSVHFALELGPACYRALGYTHTSYDGKYPPTGHDHATLLRAKGFEEAGIPDPLVLRAHSEGRMPLPETPNYEPTLAATYLTCLGFRDV